MGLFLPKEKERFGPGKNGFSLAGKDIQMPVGSL
jgi:hypothetical protein